MGLVAPLFRWLYTLEVRRDSSSRARLQAGAIPWCRRAGGRIEVLLVTTRRSGKWTIPRGWTALWRTLARSAKREALEEAGVRGLVSRQPLGMVAAPKTYRLAGRVDWQLAVFALEVTDQQTSWKEAGQRQRQWFSPEEAAEIVQPRELGALILELATTKQRQPSGGGKQRDAGLLLPTPPQETEAERGERRREHADLGGPR